MKFLIDQDVYAVTIKFLIDVGHDVIVVAQMGLAQASDEEILRGEHLSYAMSRNTQRASMRECDKR